MKEEFLIQLINESLGIAIPDNLPKETLHERLSDYVNQMIESDFERLVNLLYRIDVDEEKLRDLLLKNQGQDAGSIIAGLIIERQINKLKSKESFRRVQRDDGGEERWND